MLLQRQGTWNEGEGIRRDSIMTDTGCAGSTADLMDGRFDRNGYGHEYAPRPSSQIPTDNFQESSGNFDISGVQQHQSGGTTPCVVRQERTGPTPPQTSTHRFAGFPRDVTQTNEMSVDGVNNEASCPTPSLQAPARSFPERANIQHTSTQTMIQPVPICSYGSMERNTTTFFQVNSSNSGSSTGAFTAVEQQASSYDKPGFAETLTPHKLQHKLQSPQPYSPTSLNLFLLIYLF